jgi:hypothetical protein
MQLNDEYRLAAYAVVASIAVLAISGAIVVSGDAPADTSQLSTDETDQVDRNPTIDESNRFDISVAETNSTVSFNRSERTCRGNLRVGDSDRSRTEVELDGVTVTLIEDHDEPFNEIERERFAKLVWSEVSGHAGLDDHEHVEIRVNQYYETVDREEPLDTVGVRARPVDDCLPTIQGEVTLDDRSVDVRTAYPELDEFELNITDTIGVLSDDDRALIEQLLGSNRYTSYTIQAEFDDPAQLNATVVEATNDGEVNVALTSPAVEGRTVVTRIDIQSETVRNAWTKVSTEKIEGTETVAVGDADGNSTVTFEAETEEQE